jgi:hypothetical protein
LHDHIGVGRENVYLAINVEMAISPVCLFQ